MLKLLTVPLLDDPGIPQLLDTMNFPRFWSCFRERAQSLPQNAVLKGRDENLSSGDWLPAEIILQAYCQGRGESSTPWLDWKQPCCEQLLKLKRRSKCLLSSWKVALRAAPVVYAWEHTKHVVFQKLIVQCSFILSKWLLQPRMLDRIWCEGYK